MSGIGMEIVPIAEADIMQHIKTLMSETTIVIRLQVINLTNIYTFNSPMK